MHGLKPLATFSSEHPPVERNQPSTWAFLGLMGCSIDVILLPLFFALAAPLLMKNLKKRKNWAAAPVIYNTVDVLEGYLFLRTKEKKRSRT